MAHVVVANLTDTQYDRLAQSGIPFLEIEPGIVPRFVALVPDGMTVEEAVNRLIRVAILTGEHDAYRNDLTQTYQTNIQERRRQLAEELGL